MSSGIYRILNKTNGKVYIGKSKRIEKRRKEHFWRLRDNKHYCRHLQSAYNLYGENNFEFSILLEVDKCMLDYYEYKFLSSARNNCYNHFICNATKEGLTIDDYIKNKMSYARKNKRKVYQYTVNGEFVAVFGSIISAAKATGTNHKDISANCNHKLKSANYYFWSFVELKKEEIAAIHNSKKCKVDAVYCFNKNGDLFKVFETVKQCATYFGVSCSTIKRRLTSSTTTKVINHSIDDFIFSYSPKGC